MDLGPPISYLVLEKGTAVYSSDGHQIGKVARVLAVPEKDVFDGIVIAEHLGIIGQRFVDADQVGDLHERGVKLRLDRKACADLPKPS